jgi:hypothetical protein
MARNSGTSAPPEAKAATLRLQNRVYRGEVNHKDATHRGEHPAVVDRRLWDAVQRFKGLAFDSRPLARSPQFTIWPLPRNCR